MRIDIITVLPELLESPFAHSIMKRAQEKGLLEVHTHQLRDFAINKHGQVDDRRSGLRTRRREKSFKAVAKAGGVLRRRTIGNGLPAESRPQVTSRCGHSKHRC